MFEVYCPQCKQTRKIATWNGGDPPYVRPCKSCTQKGKPKSEETKEKLRIAVSESITEEDRVKRSEFQKAHPELWEKNLIFGKGAGWNKGQKLPERSEETKNKISEGVIKSLEKKEQENEFE